MSTEQSSTNKWLLGCLIAGAVGVLLCGGVVVFFGVLGYRAAQQIKAEIGSQIEQQQYAQNWRAPPADAGPEQLFPSAMGGWALSGHDDAAAIPELAIERDGVHATYESAGTTVNVYAYRVPMLEQSQLFEAASAAIDGAGYTIKTQSEMDHGSMHWMTFTFEPPQRIGRLWWGQDWLFVFMTETPAVNLEGFEKDYLNSIQPPPTSGVDEELPADPTAETTPVEESTPPQPQEPTETAPDSPDVSADETAPAEPESNETAPADPNTGAQ